MINTMGIIRGKRGFFMIEAIFAILLFAMVQVYQGLVSQDAAMEANAEELGKDLAEILYAIDKRILLDGRVDQTIDPNTGVVTKGDWNGVWGTTQEFFENMLGEQLIATDHPICGKPMGWVPKAPQNNGLALVNCYLMNETFTPFGFEFEAARTSVNGVDTHVLGDWWFVAYQPTDADFEDNFKYFSTIRNKAELYDSLEMTGQHEVKFVDRTLPNYPELVSVRDCLAVKSACAIQFKYRVSSIGENANDPYAKIDGSTPFVGDLNFRTTAANPEQCFDADGQSVNCGFDFDLTNGNLDLYANSMTGNEFKLIYEHGGVPIKTVCPDMGNAQWDSGAGKDIIPDVTCGISVVNESGSAIAIAHLNKIYANQIVTDVLETTGEIKIRESFDSSDPKFKNYMKFTSDSIAYWAADSETSKIRLKDGIEVNAHGTLSMLAQKADIKAVKGIAMEGEEITFISDNLKLQSSIDQTSHIDSPYITNQTKSAVATEAMLYDGVTIVGMDAVPVNSSVTKKKCPTTSFGKTPTLQAITYPAAGFFTNDKNVGFTCKTNTKDFMNVTVETTATPRYSGKSQVTVINTEIKGEIGCDPARDTSVSYSISDRGNHWTPKMYFHGGTKYELQDADMMVIQYCDYTK